MRVCVLVSSCVCVCLCPHACVSAFVSLKIECSPTLHLNFAFCDIQPSLRGELKSLHTALREDPSLQGEGCRCFPLSVDGYVDPEEHQ